ncbi:tetratricopeptide repeat-containing protein [Parasphingorhabdus cellanae]|uniref:DUF4071 domain-containing protein n=1 Tax=Parasphingorhabdus cellanae TaxID=2806553 RepID=A0ABX7T6F1_9SPHN|nr:tetratricopeptide repeat-containing protein [Parasphingorhabdus cellanae]QTD57189.1 hypothetical protein J4G78_06495 [Parasphingorhabdus cellanae]
MTTLLQILSIARSGNPTRAWSLFHAAGWDERIDEPKALTLKGRLLKDRAKATSGTECKRYYGKAAQAYMLAAEIEGDNSYPLINAATLALLGGNAGRSIELAKETLSLIDRDPTQGENAYWRAATRSEALLLLGNDSAARRTLTEAIAKLPLAWEDHAATIGQFELILSEQGKDGSWLDRHRPPASLYFSGMIGLDENNPKTLSTIKEVIDNKAPRFGFGALAAGADILIAEALLKSGAELHVTLPYSIDRFREVSVTPFGRQWVPRFDALVESAVNVYSLPEMPSAEERSLDAAVEMANLVAMGHSIRNAGLLRSTANALTIVDLGKKPGRNFPSWLASDRDYTVIEADRKPNMVRGSGSNPIDNTSDTLCATLFLGNVCKEIADIQQSQQIEFTKVGSGYCFESTQILQVCAIAKSVAKKFDGIRASLMIDVMDRDNPSQLVLEQAKDIALASSGGSVLTDYKSAMVLTLLSKENSIQEIGELKTAYGAIPIWIIA